MKHQPFKSVSFEWLSESGEGPKYQNFGQSGWLDYPMPPQSGKGGYEALDLTLGLTYVRTRLEFSPAVKDQYLPLIKVDAEFSEPTFQAMSFHGLRGEVREEHPPAQLTVLPGMDLFRHTQRYRSTFLANATFSGDACHISISRRLLSQLLGDELGDLLMERLTISKPPAVSVRQIPLHVSQLLFNADTTTLFGATRTLFCQAKILEYLAALTQYMGVGDGRGTEKKQKYRQLVHTIHSQLVASEGQLPTLDEMAKQYGRSAKLLNEGFAQEFGKSIYSFMLDYRLMQAHAALQNSNASIKHLAAQLGYSHVNNFTIAFKRKFGYPPGSLRR
jgi:AraC-like DNA-binding protein